MSVPAGQVPTAVEGQVPATASATTPATTTPATTPETPAAKTYDEEYVRKLRDEAAAHRTKLKAFEDAEAEAKKAAMSETERLKAEVAEAKQAGEAAMARAREALGKAAVTAAAAKLGVNGELAQKLVSVEFDGEGNPTGVDEALAKLVKDHPYLIAAAASSSPTNPPRGGGPAITDPKQLPRLGMGGLFKS